MAKSKFIETYSNMLREARKAADMITDNADRAQAFAAIAQALAPCVAQEMIDGKAVEGAIAPLMKETEQVDPPIEKQMYRVKPIPEKGKIHKAEKDKKDEPADTKEETDKEKPVVPLKKLKKEEPPKDDKKENQSEDEPYYKTWDDEINGVTAQEYYANEIDELLSYFAITDDNGECMVDDEGIPMMDDEALNRCVEDLTNNMVHEFEALPPSQLKALLNMAKAYYNEDQQQIAS